MRNTLKNKMSSFYFQNFSKSSYQLISKVSGKEEIYYRDNKLVVLIEDEEIGKRIYPVIKSLNSWKHEIISDHYSFQIEGYIADKFDTIQMFFVNIYSCFENTDMSRKHQDSFTTTYFCFESEHPNLAILEKLQEFVSFTYGIEKKGYLLDSTLFDNETCQTLSGFLSFFKPSGTEIENSNGCMIEYIHYRLSGGESLNDCYGPIVKENKICAIDDFPYHMPIIIMCYQYYLNGSIPQNVNLVLKEEEEEKSHSDCYFNYWLVSNPDLSSQYTITEENDSYTVYDGKIKIYKEEISEEYERFLEIGYDFLEDCSEQVKECFTSTLVDFNGKTIGYQYQLNSLEDEQFVLEREFHSQSEIIEFVSSIARFVSEIAQKVSFDFELCEEKFNLETDIVCSKNNEFRVLKIQDLYHFVITNPEILKKQVTMIFFKLLLAYLEKRYGKLSDKKQILEKKEVRYLSPGIAKEFVKFILEKSYNISKATEVFYRFINYNIAYAESDLMYDKNFLYNPAKSIPFLFEYEIESKYGIKVQKNSSVCLSDNRKLISFSKKISITRLRNDVEDMKEAISRRFRHIDEDYVKLTSISEIIYSCELDAKEMYKVAGYITTPLQGVPITKKMLLGFNNKEMLQVAGKLISSFGNQYLDSEQVLIDKNEQDGEFTFYIDILDPNFEILDTSDSLNKRLKKFFEFLKANDYNPNAFVGLDLSRNLANYARKLDTYCNVHKIYYDGHEKMCPVCSKTQYIVDSHFEDKYEKIYEDDYAVHYSNNSNHNLKIYKANAVNMECLEKNVTAIVMAGLEEECDLLQDCFIPYKKALNQNYQFIGYIYTSVNLSNEICHNLNDVESLSNRARIMSLIRLIKQVNALILKGYTFDRNPFGDVFLSQEHKKQVQIVNIDFLSKKGKSAPSMKWLYEYVYKVINSDANIELDTSAIAENKMLSKLEELAQELDVACPIHKIYYSSKYLFCPKCADRSVTKKIEIEPTSADTIERWDYFNQGGESIIYQRKDGSLAKIFKEDSPEFDYSFKIKILLAIFAKKEILEQINQEKHKFHFIIPQHILVDFDNNRILGYVMDKKVKGVSLSVLRDKEEVSNLGFSRKDVFEILITVGEGIQILHERANIYVGDLNGRNILVDGDKNVYFLDFDGMGMDNIAPKFWTEGYIDPVSQKSNNITPKDDWYSFALQAFYYLTFVHPFNGIYISNGNRLTIPERMEQKLSLLGNHGIDVPSVAEPWDWMNTELRNAFLNIFEGESRRSIVPELKKQYSEKYGVGQYQTIDSIIRINDKFVAKRNQPFDDNVVRNITPYAAICNEDEDYYVRILLDNGTQDVLYFPNCMEIIDILCLESHVIAVYQDRLIGFYRKTGEGVFFESFNNESDNVVVNKNTIYLTKEHQGEHLIYQVTFNTGGDVKREKIKFLPEQQTVGFLVKFNSKFMLIKRKLNGNDVIYCNSEKLCNLGSSSENSKYQILYDEITKLWLVITDKGRVITVKSNGYREEFKIPVEIDDMNVRSVVFYNGILYIPTHGALYIVNVKKEMATKRLECDKLMTPDSRLFNFNSKKGFSVITDYVLYDIYKE